MMNSDTLCIYCDNKIMPNDTKCFVCNADIQIDSVITSKIVSKECNEKDCKHIASMKENIKESGLVFRGIHKEMLQGSSNDQKYQISMEYNDKDYKPIASMKENIKESGLVSRGIHKEMLQGSSNDQKYQISMEYNDKDYKHIDCMKEKNRGVHNKMLQSSSNTHVNNIYIKEDEEKDSFWICSFCTFRNESSYLTCKACLKEKLSCKESIAIGKTERNNCWICQFCKFSNIMENKSCSNCPKIKNEIKENIHCDKGKAKINERNKEETYKKKKINETLWTCQFCQFNNKTESEFCEVCYQMKIGNNELNHDDGNNSENDGRNNAEIYDGNNSKNNYVSDDGNNIKNDDVSDDGNNVGNNDRNFSEENDRPIGERNVGDIISDKDKIDKSLLASYPWNCLGCFFMNEMPALKCYECDKNNQIFRVCTYCEIYFIMNDFDNVCVNCLITSSSRCSKSISENEFDNKYARSEKKSKILQFFTLFKKNWVCNDIKCKTKMKEDEVMCTKCGLSKEPKNISKDNIKVKSKDKVWICEKEECRKENKMKHIYCSDCGKYINSEEVYVKKPTKESKKTSWHCDDQSCATKNKSDATQCKKCERSRPAFSITD